MLLKASVKVSKGIKSAFKGTVCYGIVGVFHKITDVAQTIVSYIGVKGNTYGLFKIAGEI